MKEVRTYFFNEFFKVFFPVRKIVSTNIVGKEIRESIIDRSFQVLKQRSLESAVSYSSTEVRRYAKYSVFAKLSVAITQAF